MWRDVYRWKPSWVIMLVAAGAALTQAYEYIFPLGHGWVYDYGAGLETIPVHVALVNQHALGSSLAPFVAAGVDRLSFFGNADSPLILSTWLFAFLSPPVANGIHMMLQSFVGSMFAGLLCHDRLKLGMPISAVAVVTYVSFSYPVFGFLFNAASIPFFAWLLTVPQTRSWPTLLLVGLAATFLTSLSQGFPFIALFIALWMPVMAGASVAGTAKTLLGITIGYCAGKLPTLLAILNSVALSQRSGELRYDSLIDTPILYTESDFLYNERHMWTYTQAVPAFFAALCAAFFAFALVQRWRHDSYVDEADPTAPLFVAILRLGIIYVILASGILLAIRTLLIPAFPWLGSVNMVRTITASGALLNTLVVAHGLAAIEWAIRRGAFGWVIVGASAAVGFCWIIRHSETVPTDYALLLLILTTGMIISALWGGGQTHGAALVSVLTAALALFYGSLAPKILLAPLRDAPQSGFARYYIPAIHEIEGRDRTLHRYASVLPLQPASALVSGIESLDGWANLYSSKFRQFWLAILGPLFEELPEERRIFGTEERPPQDHFIFLGTGAFLPSDPIGGMDVDRRFNMNLLSLMNVGYLLSYYPISSKYLVEIHAPVRPLERTNWDYATGRVVGLAEPGGGWPSMVRGLLSAVEGPQNAEDRVYAYRNVCTLPRAFSVARLEQHDSDREVMRSLIAGSPAELMRTAHALNTDAPPVAEHLAALSLRLTAYRAGEIDLDAAGAGEAVIVFAYTWLPGWRAYIDGHEVSVFRVNHTQIGLHLPKSGTFHIKLAYEPAYSWLTDIVTTMTPPAVSQAPDHELGLSEFPPVCASNERAKSQSVTERFLPK